MVNDKRGLRVIDPLIMALYLKTIRQTEGLPPLAKLDEIFIMKMLLLHFLRMSHNLSVRGTK